MLSIPRDVSSLDNLNMLVDDFMTIILEFFDYVSSEDDKQDSFVDLINEQLAIFKDTCNYFASEYKIDEDEKRYQIKDVVKYRDAIIQRISNSDLIGSVREKDKIANMFA
ncbi:MAG: hypothetical protein LBM13_00375 [Candidatus Ancillula sp.]|jgi:hypothetical protein|nr:hypothetical protein [Candidatus Ancillula sp.]